MADTSKTEGNNGIKKSTQLWQSDVIVDLINQHGFPLSRSIPTRG